MRKIILSLGISLDGYIARSNGDVDFLFMPKDYSKTMSAEMSEIDTAIMGRKTYEQALKMGGGFGGSIAYYVFSRTLPSGEPGKVTVEHDSPVDFVDRLRKEKGKDIWHMGGGELAREFLRADLIDEIHIGIVPKLIGEGIPLFPSGFPEREFSLIENKSWSKGLVTLKYSRLRSKAKRIR